MSLKMIISSIFLLGCLATTALGREWHVSPRGNSNATGSLNEPIDLVTALDGRMVKPGDTIWLHAGSFIGVFRSNLRGAEGSPIVVRGWPGELAVLAADVAQADGAILNIFGSWTIYRDFEITNLNRQRSHISGFRPMGIEIQAPHTTIVNLVIHDTGIGIGTWDNAPDTEIYGNVIYNSGTENTPSDKRHGHGIYVQNKTGAKLIRDNIVFNNFGWGLHVYSNVGALRNINLEGNIVFNNGVQNDSGIRYNNILVLGHARPYSAEQIVVRDNLTYHSPDQKAGSTFSDAGVSLGCGDSGTNRDLRLQNNYFVGGTPVALLCGWDTAVATGNTLVGPQGVLGVLGNAAAIRNYPWDNNRYSSAGGDTRKPQFGLNSETFQGWDSWQKAAQTDRSGAYSATHPGGAQTFVRPNAYEEGRATIVVYNWDRAETVAVDVASILAPGTPYTVHNVQDFFGTPILTGTAGNSPLRLPMRQGAVAGALGTGRTLPATGPQFAVFVVRTAPVASPISRTGDRSRGTREASPPAIASLDRYAGYFESMKPLAQAQITVRDGKLEMKLLHEAGKPSFVLDPVEPDRFRMLGAPAGFFVQFASTKTEVKGIQVFRGSNSTVTLIRR
jgi:hypothetical protein